MRFIAVAGKSSYERTAEVAPQLFRLLEWGLDDAIWELYQDPYQPYTVLITGDDIVFDTWFGALPDSEIRSKLDALVALAA